MKKLKLLGAVLVILGLILGSAYIWKKRSSPRSRSAGRTVEVAAGPIQATIDATGSVTPENRIEIKPPIQGRIDQLLVDEGDAVKAGQILAWMSSSDRAAILDAARARGPEELKRWEDSYKPTPIIAPLSGVIILRNVVQGQTVEQGTVLFAVSDRLIVTAQVDESDIGKVRKGMPVKIVLDAYPKETVRGEVFDILYEGKNVSNVITYGVKVLPIAAPPFFRSQMTATVGFITGRKANALLIPMAAVRESDRGDKQVLMPGPEGKPVPREIKTGLESGDQVEVVSGLEEGDRIILATGRYIPQETPNASPFGMRRPGGDRRNEGKAPRSRSQ
ncbi:MAG: hypothetical protein A2X36_03480 [Elusimicrobia bacterium GWA2_69_24]|nr:MAG: hypothetical protein A2X36_03480 [Elusimicrobia bacterium GWA2_69_24]